MNDTSVNYIYYKSILYIISQIKCIFLNLGKYCC